MTQDTFDTPEAAEAAFYLAFSKIDLDLMRAVWGDGDHALCVHPGSGLHRGKAAVMQSWMEIFSGSAPPAIAYRYIDGFVAENLSVRLVEERIRPRGESAEVANLVLATNVFTRIARSWHLVEHHASLPLIKPGTKAGGKRRLH